MLIANSCCIDCIYPAGNIPVVALTYKKNTRSATTLNLTQSSHLCTVRFTSVLILPDPISYLCAFVLLGCTICRALIIPRQNPSSLYHLPMPNFDISNTGQQSTHAQLSMQCMPTPMFHATISPFTTTDHNIKVPGDFVHEYVTTPDNNNMPHDRPEPYARKQFNQNPQHNVDYPFVKTQSESSMPVMVYDDETVMRQLQEALQQRM
jgi:hypothetical protein